jgi:hypothetical protein
MSSVLAKKSVLANLPRRAALVAAVAAAVLASGLAGRASAHASKADRLYTKSAVFRAFGHQGLHLYDTGYNDFNPVTALASIKPHDGWSLGVYLFRSKKLALVDFNATAKKWTKSGMAVAQVGNVVVTVVPKGASLAKPAKPWPMPQLVKSAIAALTG